MKAAIITSPGASPIYSDFPAPTAQPGLELITVTASAVSNLSKSRASGQHYSSEGVFPSIPGIDGVGRTADGRRVYFAMPESPFGALAERSLVDARRLVPIPDTLDDITAAALGNPGMSAWAAIVERAHLQPGETILINGATGTAGRIAVQLARHLGAGKIIATARNAAELETLGADVSIPLGAGFDAALEQHLANGINVVIDYLWGASAHSIIIAIAKAVEDATPIRFVHVGSSSGELEIALPGAALRSSAIQLMGSGLKSVPMRTLLSSIQQVYAIADKLTIATTTAPLSEIATTWDAPTKPRLVYTIP